MRTEKEIKDKLKEIEDTIKIYNEMGKSDPVFNAIYSTLEWILEEKNYI